ncbi:MAG: RIO1 family regulatory kinase/ATPase, partial [Pseudomonadota bacterium]|nr:RIO1 family regulatory kinase/ATPase [Pseudomonadota bacterium]
MIRLEDIQAPLSAWLENKENLQTSLLSSGYQGSVYLFHHDDQYWVVKCANDKWLTGWFHRMMLRREALVYEILSGVSGVPISLGMLDDNFLILEFIEGKVLRDVEDKLHQPESFYTKLHKIISEMHALGVAHGDLKRKDNILVTNDSQPVVIDFGTALRRDGG